MVFKDLNALKAYLKQDSSRFSLNPVRFINVDSMAMWVEVKNYLFSLADETMCLSSFCEEDDTTPNINRVHSKLKNISKNQLVSPLSEYLRIIPDQAETVIQKFIKSEYPNNDKGRLRIYFLMYRMKSLLKTLPSDDPRTKDCIVFYETNEESDYKLTIIQKELNVQLNGNEINGFKRYLQYWEANPDKPIILHTGNAIHFEKNHFFDNVFVIVSSYDLIKHRFNLPSGICEEFGTHVEWNELAKLIIKEGDFENACCSAFSINKYSYNLFERWNVLSAFHKWLLWIWTRLQPSGNYLIECAKISSSPANIVDCIYCNIINKLHHSNYDNFYNERRNVLLMLGTVPTDLFWNQISSLNTLDALLCLTNLTDIERKTIFSLISKYSYEERAVVFSVIKQIYPELYFYLHNEQQFNYSNLSNSHYQYFDEYKWLKVTDTISEDFVAKVRRIAMEKGSAVFKSQSRNYYVSKYYDSNTSILFVDGMGIEYIDYLAHLFADIDEDKYTVNFAYGYCNLPSITEINKDFMNGRKTIEPPVRDLDELKHANNVHPESIIKQLSILDGLKSRVLSSLVGATKRILIVADHGTSRLAVKVRNSVYDNVYPRPADTTIYKYGRFCNGKEDESKYPTAINYDDKLIFADYSRFIQNGAPIDEIHGGASLEEWLVPVVVVSRNDEQVGDVAVTPIKTNYKPELGTKQVTVLFKISGDERHAVNAKIRGQSYLCNYNQGIYSFCFVPAKDDKNINVKIIDNGILGQFDIKVEQGIQKNTKFDI